MSKKYSIAWWNKLTLETKSMFFINWRMRTSDNKKHWCLDDIESEDSSLNSMLQDMKSLNTHGEPIRGGTLNL